jgi:hypothetical protein
MLEPVRLLLDLLEHGCYPTWTSDISVSFEQYADLDCLKYLQPQPSKVDVSGDEMGSHLVSPEVPADIPVERVL